MSTSMSGVPMGSIVAFALSAASVPHGWLLCDGKPFDTGRYSALSTALGSNKTPSLTGRVLLGAGDLTTASTTQNDGRDPDFPTLAPPTTGQNLTVGYTGGECRHVLGVEEIPSHSHSINSGNFGTHHRSFEGNDDRDLPFETNPDNYLGRTDAEGGGGGHYNVQPYFAVNYIIRAAES